MGKRGKGKRVKEDKIANETKHCRRTLQMNIKQKGAKKEENKNIKEVNKSDRIRGREFLK